MALTGLQIFKLLPNTNCKDCGYPTCLAFAMQLAAKKVELDLCPHASEEAKQVLGADATPPVRGVTVGTGPDAVRTGEETVLFRHDKTFLHPAVFALGMGSDLDESGLKKRIQDIHNIEFQRAGEDLKVDMIALLDKNGDPAAFRKACRAIMDETAYPLLLSSEKEEVLRSALEQAAVRRPLIDGASGENWEAFAALAKEFGVPLVVKSPGTLQEQAELVEKIKENGVEDLVIDPGAGRLGALHESNTIIRRAALEDSFKTFGFPILQRLSGDDLYRAGMRAALGVCKYSSIILFEDFAPWQFLPLLTLRQNIYTDPQKPLQVEAGIYYVGEPGKDAPVFITTNFSLTYFIVSSEIESTGVPSHLMIVDVEGMSVLTAWSAGKFGGADVAKVVKASDLEARIDHRKVIIPGYVSVISGELEDELSGWEVMVGPQEASDIGSYLKEIWSS